jgi:glycosyltransferase involved in cell wall biosynthesis
VIKPLPFRLENADAAAYVATLPEEGLAQLEILKSLGCQPHHKVLEIGCGALVAGYPIMQYLDAGGYSGIEPNGWLVISTLSVPEVAAVAVEKRPLFCPRSDFRAEPGAKFDFIVSHSILSHASNAQLTDFLTAAAEQLAEGGVLVASIRLAEGNDVGSPGSARHGAAFTEWQYPGVSWFKQADVIERARRLGLSATVSKDVQSVLLNGNPKAVHDWLVVRRTKVTLVTGFFRLPDRPVDEAEQFRRFEELAACGMPIILFLDPSISLTYQPRPRNVCVINTGLEDLTAFDLAEDRDLELPSHRDPAKDTRDFLLLQNSKLNLLEMAVSLDSESTHFAWIDFGVMKIVREPESFLERLRRLTPPSSCVLAPGCWSREDSDARTTDDTVCWRFCGGFLLADRSSVSGLVRRHLMEFEIRPKSLTWEVNIWAAMERFGQHFDWYKADHDDSIIGWDPPIETPSTVRVCLVMIVKNESAIIERCLEAALPFIDTWCITDTGSTDGTPEKITKFFGERGIRGALARTTFKNFAQARNEALDNARSFPEWDYALLIDADMVLDGTLDKSMLTAPAYRVSQHTGDLSYTNTRLVRRDVPAKYFGVTHEYLSVEGVEDLTGFAINDVNDGGSKSDKGERDIRLLNDGLTTEPNNERYMFYLAQVYREVGRHHEAINWYRRRIERGGWDEEIWAAYYGIARSYKELGEEANFIRAALEAHNYRPSRGESLKSLAQHFRETSKNESALLIAVELATIPYPGDHLFVERDVYDFGAAQEVAIAGYYSKTPMWRQLGYRACADLTTHANKHVREEARKNFTFYAKSAKEIFCAEVREIDWKPSDGWAPMNPSVYIFKTEDDNIVIESLLVLVRTVNYTVADGEYPTIDGSGIIRTRNYVLNMSVDWCPVRATPIEDLTGLPRSGFPVEGFEDCRLWRAPTCYFVSATVRDLADNPDGRCEMVTVRLDQDYKAVEVTPIRDYEHDKTQKNWMPIIGHPGRFLYLCDPTIVIEDTESGTVELMRHAAPAGTCLVDLRGGSQLIPHHDGWLCITHEVAWRPERVYLHRFVHFDADFKIIALSDPFYFKHVGIEFCAGLARDGDRLVASFGVNDASAHLVFFEPDAIDCSLKYV